MERCRVYVAGPITLGDQMVNARKAIDVSHQLLKLGFVPYCPHLSALWQLIHPMNLEQWLDYDLVWLAQCHCVLRLPGESKGADMETDFATGMGIPIYHDIVSLQAGVMAMEDGKDMIDERTR